ncbi:MAG: serine hydrolase domain-containing protein, partial [Flavobacteriaceae bacterium]
MRQLFTLLLGIFLSFGTSLEAQTPFDVAYLTDFENYLKTEIDSAQIAGVEVLIYHNQKKVWHKALGYNSIQTKAPLEKNSIYFIQSMTKPIMSVAIMQL